MAPEVLVYFRLERTGPWPPVPSEGLRAEPLGGGTYRLLEAPFFVRNIARSDVVGAAVDADGVLWAGERVSWSGHQTLRVNPRAGGPALSRVVQDFAALGAVGEELEEYQLVALDVPPGVEVEPLHALLLSGAGELWWYEEACVGPTWPA